MQPMVASGTAYGKAERQPKVLVLLCRRLGELGSGLDLAEAARWLRESISDVDVQIVAGLCERHGVAARVAASEAVRLVLGLCATDCVGPDVDAGLRGVGLDPLGIEKVNLGGYCALAHARARATDKAKALLEAAVARARAFTGSGPQDVKPILVRGQERITRRALFSLPPISYQPVASIDPESCATDTECRLCVEACPLGALAPDNGRVVIDKSRCDGCGACVSRCPRGAIRLAGHSLSQIEAQVATLLRTPSLPSSEPRAILFLCEPKARALDQLARTGTAHDVLWLPVHLPCAGMVRSSWLLACLASGANAVAVLACEGDCPFRQEEDVGGEVGYCRELVALLGGSPDRGRLLPGSPETALAGALREPPEAALPSTAPNREIGGFSGARSAAQAVMALAAAYASPMTLSLAHRFSPVGLVRVDSEKCTGCGTCARACPTGALAFEQEEGSVALTFDPTLCTGCGLCRDRCPEQAVQTDKVTDLGALSRGKAVLYQDETVRCEMCGGAIAPARMLRQIGALLSGDVSQGAALTATITRRCPSCRIAASDGQPF